MLPKCVVFAELVRGAGCVRGQEKDWMGHLLDDLRVFGINADSGRLQPRTSGNGARQRNKGGNVRWLNGLLQRKSGLDYGMQ